MSKPVKEDHWFHNECLDWGTMQRDSFTKWRFDYQPEGIEQKDWEFCYYFQPPDDVFSFDGDVNGLPLKDYYAPKELVDETCKNMCSNQLSGMERFDTKKGGDFTQITGYHHFDDICTKHMECDKGPKA
ncbi:MAG: hypothetical protein L6R37_008253 [Teloschistes peruensis]|nr:MAG: hypothetical protein L6R37_008253 [Teloschistes peruensis]